MTFAYVDGMSDALPGNAVWCCDIPMEIVGNKRIFLSRHTLIAIDSAVMLSVPNIPIGPCCSVAPSEDSVNLNFFKNDSMIAYLEV